MFEKIRTAANQIFEDFYTKLSENYPGINKQIFLRELMLYIGEETSEDQIVDSKIESKIIDFKKLVIEGVPFEYISGRPSHVNRSLLVQSTVNVNVCSSSSLSGPAVMLTTKATLVCSPPSSKLETVFSLHF